MGYYNLTFSHQIVAYTGFLNPHCLELLLSLGANYEFSAIILTPLCFYKNSRAGLAFSRAILDSCLLGLRL